MVICLACEKPIKRNTYSWSLGWSRTNPSFGGPGREAFELRCHNKPECIAKLTQRLDDYSWEQGMFNALDRLAKDDGVEFYIDEEG